MRESGNIGSEPDKDLTTSFVSVTKYENTILCECKIIIKPGKYRAGKDLKISANTHLAL